jgi:hypothetical protein
LLFLKCSCREEIAEVHSEIREFRRRLIKFEIKSEVRRTKGDKSVQKEIIEVRVKVRSPKNGGRQESSEGV